MSIRSFKKNFKMAATKEVKSWHQHINATENANERHPFSSYLIGRNKVYLSKKHYSFCKTVYVFSTYAKIALKGIVVSIIKKKPGTMQSSMWLLYGMINGLFGNMKHNKYSKPI